jgi:serine/threonine protein phosphatase 1
MWPTGECAGAVPAGTRVYAVGDVHGCAALLDRLHARIRDDARDAPERRKVVVYLGDYVDRGPDSAGVIDRLLDDPLPGFETVYLKGNHEDFMLRFLDDPSVGGYWLMNGGGATLASYDVTETRPGRSAGPADGLGDAFRARLPAAHREFLDGLRLMHREGDFVFVHAGIRPDTPLDAQTEEDLLWIREPFLGSPEDRGFVVVHGHTPVESPELLFNRINVDTGAVWTGRLTALVLHAGEQYFLQTGAGDAED